MAREVELSVVIPFRNASPHLRDQLEAVASQELDVPWEAILVDNGSSDDSLAIARSFSERMHLRLVDASERPGSAYARNLGARAAAGSKLIFIDADDEIAPGYLAAMSAGLERHDFVTSAFDHEALNPEWVRRAHGPLWRDPDEPLFVQSGVLPFAGGSIGVSRAVFESVGGFPEEFRRMQDIAFSWEVQLAGTVLAYVPDAVYRVRYRQSLAGLFRQGLAGGSTAPLLYRRYRSAGMQRRSVVEVIRSWGRLVRDFARARTKADLAPLMLQLGRELGRLRGSVRHRTFFP